MYALLMPEEIYKSRKCMIEKKNTGTSNKKSYKISQECSFQVLLGKFLQWLEIQRILRRPHETPRK